MKRLTSFAACFLLVGMAPTCPPAGAAAPLDRLSEARQRAIAFLERAQNPDGSFPAELCRPAEGNCRTSPTTVFTSAMVLYALRGVRDPQAQAVFRKGTAFLEREERPGGLWRFYGKAPSAPDLSADSDDTALASFLLAGTGKAASNRDRFAANRDEGGRFYTWFRNPGEKNDVDSVVNANVLLYLGDGPTTETACRWLASLVREGKEAGSIPYYVHATDLYYALARAYAHGAGCLEPAMPVLRERVIGLVGPDGSVGGNVQHTLLAALALSYAGCLGPELEAMRAFVVGSQEAEGSFAASFIFAGPEPPSPRSTFWRSAAVTTALAVELLSFACPGERGR
jgi:hypothetical protein